jgi:hypothetical protein
MMETGSVLEVSIAIVGPLVSVGRTIDALR